MNKMRYKLSLINPATILKKLAFLFLFFAFSFSMEARIRPDSLTKSETLHLIDSITHSPFRRISNVFSYENNKLMLSQEIYLSFPTQSNEGPISYMKHFHENGKVQREGLLSGHEVGTWMYYDTTGRLYKEYDFTSHTRKLYGMEIEPLEWAFDSVVNMTERFMFRHYAAFNKTQIRIDTLVTWYPNRYLPGSCSWPDIPLVPPKEYTVYARVIINDSITGTFHSFKYDSNLQLADIYNIYFEDTATFYPKLKISYDYALKLARSKGFNSVSLSEWDKERKAFFWTASKTLSSEGTARHQRTHEQGIEINGNTGKYSIREYSGGYDADGFISDFQDDWNDTLQTAEGWKSEQLSKLTLDLPVNWITISNYHHKGSYRDYLFTDGTDTLFYRETCGYFADSENGRYKRDELREKAFEAHFPKGTVQGRSMEMLFIVDNGQFRIEYSIEESGVAFNCGPVNYMFKTSKMDDARADLMLSILKTVRFSTY
jgi:hypothetical protein